MRAITVLICSLAALSLGCEKETSSGDAAKSPSKAKEGPAKKEVTKAAAGTKKAPSGAATTKAPTSKAAPDSPAVQVGKPAPDFTLKGVDGASVSLSQFKGKTVAMIADSKVTRVRPSGPSTSSSWGDTNRPWP